MITIATTFSALTVILLAILTAVWINNYRTFRTNLILGLIAFSLLLLVENLVAIYFFFSMDMLYAADPTIERVVALLRTLQFVAVLFLTYVSLK